MTEPIESEPIWAKEYTTGTNIVWYFPVIENKLIKDTRHLLEVYSGIPPAEVLPHVNAIRDKAWAVRSYMCTGQGAFLIPTVPLHPSYSTILERLKNGAKLVDVGTFIGQDLRKLVVDGALSTNMYAVDIVNHWDIGFEMFRDKDKFHAHYIEADILHPNSALQELNGKMDIIWITHVLHQWIWEGQIIAAKTLVALSRQGTLIAGYQIGHEQATHVKPNPLMKGESFLHDPVSFVKMWDQIGEETGTKWKTQAQYRALSEMGWEPEDLPTPGRKVVQFTVERIE